MEGQIWLLVVGSSSIQVRLARCEPASTFVYSQSSMLSRSICLQSRAPRYPPSNSGRLWGYGDVYREERVLVQGS